MRTVFLVLREPGRRWQPERELREQPGWASHAAFMSALFDSGFLLFGGPLTDLAGKMVLVVAADTVDAVRKLLAQDPWTQSDVLRVASVHAWEWTLATAPRAMASTRPPPRAASG